MFLFWGEVWETSFGCCYNICSNVLVDILSLAEFAAMFGTMLELHSKIAIDVVNNRVPSIDVREQSF